MMTMCNRSNDRNMRKKKTKEREDEEEDRKDIVDAKERLLLDWNNILMGNGILSEAFGRITTS